MTREGGAGGIKSNGRGRSEAAIINSALWSAAGDALGWITELSYGPAGVVRRTGEERVVKPVAWRRRIGGRGGPTVELPAGTYSDDTQLRLAVGRSIRGDGSFDVETFAKIEVTVWLAYALGAGSGTKAAASSLSRRKVNWFSNFFEVGRQRYVIAGGNGAAMRIQPHVWAGEGDRSALILEVLRNALVTHGHPHGFCGAVFHALCLADTLFEGRLPGLEKCREYTNVFPELEGLVSGDSQLSIFWKGHWEEASGKSFGRAMAEMWEEANRDIEVVERELGRGIKERRDVYHSVLSELGCLDDKYRGSGFKTALAAMSLAQIFAPSEIEVCLETAVNELDSDTDTIATMAGALLGSISECKLEWPVQDREYIVKEARRMFAISRGQAEDSFPYPDLSGWNPPGRQNAAIGLFDDDLALVGLGRLSTVSEEYESTQGTWQWLALPFGQTILAKRKRRGGINVMASQLPGGAVTVGLKQTNLPVRERSDEYQGKLPHDSEPPIPQGSMRSKVPVGPAPNARQRPLQEAQETVDSWTREVISSDFDERVLGRMLNRCIDKSQSVESAIGFASIIAKARLARQRHRR